MTDTMYTTGEYAEKNKTWHTEDSPWKASHVIKMLNAHQLTPQTVCEIGCGAGEILRQLQLQLPEHTRFFGYEISPQAFEMCKTRANERLQFFHEDLLSVSVEPYDLQLCMDVFEHVEDYMGFLQKLRQKATYFIFHIPLDMSVYFLMRGKIMARRNKVGHLHYFSKETALHTLIDTGYSIIDSFYTPSGLHLPQNTNQRLMAYPRKALAWINPDIATRILGGYSLLVLAKNGMSD